MLTPRGRQAWLTAHIVSSVGWIGAVAAFVVLDLATAFSAKEPLLRAAYIAMDLVARYAIVPLAMWALATGLVVSLGTRWGLFRHYWVVVSLALTVLSTLVLMVQLPLIGQRAELAADPQATAGQVREAGTMLVHSVGGIVVLLAILVLNVAKPKGLTPYGWRRQQEEGSAGTKVP